MSGDGGGSAERRLLEELLRSRPDIAGWHPLSAGQQALWFLHRLAPDSPAYNLIIAGPGRTGLDLDRLGAAFEATARRHAALRTAIRSVHGRPMAIVEQEPNLTLERVDVPGATTMDLLRRAEADGRIPFRLDRAPLVRLRAYWGTGDRPLISIVAHHIIVDLLSAQILLADAQCCYLDGEVTGPPARPYADFVAHQRRVLANDAGHLAYWRDRISAAHRAQQNPQPPAARDAVEGGDCTLTADLHVTLAARIRQAAAGNEATAFSWLLAVWCELMSERTGSGTVVVGVPLEGRPFTGFDDTVGLFANTMPLVIRTDGGFADTVRETQRAVAQALEHQDYPFAAAVERLRVARPSGHQQLFGSVFVSMGAARWADDIFEPAVVGHCGAPFELMLTVSEGPAPRLQLTYDTAVYRREHAAALLTRYLALIDRALDAQAPGRSHTVVDLVLAQSARTPDAVAVEAAGRSYTYRELASRVEAVARGLATAGIGAGDLVGVALSRSVLLPAVLLGIMHRGAAYIPLDPTYPAARVAQILDDAKPALLLVDKTTAGAWLPTHLTQIDVDTFTDTDTDAAPPPAATARADSLAYVIYTSGSSGRPKGVEVEHRSVTALLEWAPRHYGAPALSRVLASTSVSFDLSVFELFAPLVAGGTAVLVDQLWHLDDRHAPTLVNTVPSILAELLRWRTLPDSVDVVNLAGESLTQTLVDLVYSRSRASRVVNLYGPTEATVYSTCADCPPGHSGAPTIGFTLPGEQAVVLDERQLPVPDGEAGELYLSGVGIARGYRGRPDLTAAAFLSRPGQRLYRTGDLARRRPDGRLEFLGRLDDQVKVHGVRIELADVEHALGQLPAVSDAALLASNNGDIRHLAAYVVAAAGVVLDTRQMRADLKLLLPTSMIPAVIHIVASIPRQPNGKVDRVALRGVPAPAATERPTPPSGQPTDFHRIAAAAWCQVLNVDALGLDDDFFESGGGSLHCVEVSARLTAELGFTVPPEYLFAYPTIRQLEAGLQHLDSARRNPR